MRRRDVPAPSVYTRRCRARKDRDAWCADVECNFVASTTKGRPNGGLKFGTVQSRARAHRLKTGHEVRVDTTVRVQTFYSAGEVTK
jgi:hypothetical protein